MKDMPQQLILASASPRRKALLAKAGLKFDIVPADVDETLRPDILPDEAVQMLSERKANAVFKDYPQALVIAADTVVALKDRIFGKPSNEKEAFRMLKILSGQTHQVCTGVALKGPSISKVFCCSTDVTFFSLNDEEIKAYIQTGEPMDKAGAYGIQGLGCFLVEKISGNYENVVGLPIGLLLREIRDLQRSGFYDREDRLCGGF